jgi:hypothetical protein
MRGPGEILPHGGRRRRRTEEEDRRFSKGLINNYWPGINFGIMGEREN